jgi:hypothetical protein
VQQRGISTGFEMGIVRDAVEERERGKWIWMKWIQKLASWVASFSK